MSDAMFSSKGGESDWPAGLLGRLVSITGSQAVILLDTGSDAAAPADRPPEIGTLVKFECAATVVLGLVGALNAPLPSQNVGEPELRLVEVEFVGELVREEDGSAGAFRRGVSTYPALGDPAYAITRTELARAHACDAHTAIRIGVINQDPSIPAMARLDDLLGKHFALLGTTGMGKSCAVALILQRIIEKAPEAHIMLLDVHREYAACFADHAEIIALHTLNLPFWLLTLEDIVEILVGRHADRQADIEILRELIPAAKLRYAAKQRGDRKAARKEDLADSVIGVDTPVPYRASDLIALLDEQIGRLDLKGGLAPYKRLKAQLETVTRDPRFAFMFGSPTVQDTMSDILGRLFRIPVDGRPIAIVELGSLPSEVTNVVVSVLSRLAFDFGMWSEGRVPLMLVCEEAHRYVPSDTALGFEPTKRAISRIAKEGRKHGVSLCLVSQRPSDLDPTILSQCSTLFAMRLSNEHDQEIVRAGVPDTSAGLLGFVSIMGPGEAVALGEGTSLPTRMRFDRLTEETMPRTRTAAFSERWTESVSDDGFLAATVRRWRLQGRGETQG